MENETNANSADTPAKIKPEPEDSEASSINESPNEVIKNEPLEEPVNSSSIRITNSFSVPVFVAVDSNVTVKTEEENDNPTKPNVNGETSSNSSDLKVEADIKKESSTETTFDNSCKLFHSRINNAIKIDEENTSSSNGTSTNTIPSNDSVQVNPPADENAIAKILSTSMPSTSVSCSSFNCDQTDDVSSSTCDDLKKPPCRYGKSCYRLNELHRKNFSHPSGSDPLKSPEKPRCKYGSRCYRKNEDHRKRFIHARSPDNPLSNTRKRKVRNVASQTTGHVYESDSDDDSYLYEEYDGTSDEFHPDDETDSDDETDFDDDADDQILLNTD